MSGAFTPTAFKHFKFPKSTGNISYKSEQDPASKHKFLLDAPCIHASSKMSSAPVYRVRGQAPSSRPVSAMELPLGHHENVLYNLCQTSSKIAEDYTGHGRP